MPSPASHMAVLPPGSKRYLNILHDCRWLYIDRRVHESDHLEDPTFRSFIMSKDSNDDGGNKVFTSLSFAVLASKKS